MFRFIKHSGICYYLLETSIQSSCFVYLPRVYCIELQTELKILAFIWLSISLVTSYFMYRKWNCSFHRKYYFFDSGLILWYTEFLSSHIRKRSPQVRWAHSQQLRSNVICNALMWYHSTENWSRLLPVLFVLWSYGLGCCWFKHNIQYTVHTAMSSDCCFNTQTTVITGFVKLPVPLTIIKWR